ncbi:hypothetical protein [Pseudofulvimonas gallinarii]
MSRNTRASSVPAAGQAASMLRVVLAALLIGAAEAHAANTVRLPDWVCAHADALFVDGFSGAAAVVRQSSGGAGGAAPGAQSRTVNVPGYGSHTYYLYVPTRHASIRPMPVLLALHGAAGSASMAQLAAQWLRDDWITAAEAGGFLVVAPAATGSSGGWVVPPPSPSDYSIFEAALADAEAAYDIDRSRRIGWGFSAGAHVMHDLGFNHYSATLHIDTLAAFAVGAGTMSALACGPEPDCTAMVSSASRKIPVSIHIGDSDPVQPYAAADRGRLLAQGWVEGDTLFYTPFAGGHEYHYSHLAQVWSDLCRFQVLP